MKEKIQKYITSIQSVNGGIYGEDCVIPPFSLAEDLISKPFTEIKRHGSKYKDLRKPIRLLDVFYKSGELILVSILFLDSFYKDLIKDDKQRVQYILDNCLYGFSDAKLGYLRNRFFKVIDNIWPTLDCSNLLGHISLQSIFEVKIEMKFDVVIGNPPYKRDLHLQFLKKAIDLSERFVIFVHPAQWIINNRDVKRTNICKEVLKEIEGKVQEITLLDLSKKIPEVKMHSLSDIIFIDKNGVEETLVKNEVAKKSWKISTFKNFSQYGYSKEYANLKVKIKTRISDSLYSHLKADEDKKYFVNIPFVRGHFDFSTEEFLVNDFFTFLPRRYKSEEIPNFNFIGFDNRDEATHLINYLKTYFARACLLLNKTDQRLTGNTGKIVALVPWLDFTKSWDDESLFKHFDLSEKEIQFIYDHIPEYYEEVTKPRSR